jgi:hypothetical protein
VGTSIAPKLQLEGEERAASLEDEPRRRDFAMTIPLPSPQRERVQLFEDRREAVGEIVPTTLRGEQISASAARGRTVAKGVSAICRP